MARQIRKRWRYLHWDVNELDEVADNTHDAKTDSNSSAELLVFYKNHHVSFLLIQLKHFPCASHPARTKQCLLLLMTYAIHSILVDCPASCYSNERHMDVKDRRSRRTISHED